MNDTGIDRSTAKTNQQQPCQCYRFPQRQKKRRYPNHDDPLPHTNHLGIIEFQGQETAQRPSHGDADKEKTGKAGGSLRRDSPVQHQITAGPQTGGLLQRAVAKKCNQNLFYTGDPENLFQGQLFCRGRFHLFGIRTRFRSPEWKAQQNDDRQHHLHHADDPIPRLPPGMGRKRRAHDVGPDRGSDSPHTMEPAHVAAGKMERHIVVECRIHASSPKSIRNCPQAHGPERAADGEPEQCSSGHGNADGRNTACSKPADHPVTLQAGKYRSHRYDAEDHAGIGDRNPKPRIDRRPRRPQQRIRQAQTDKRNIDHR